MNSNFCSFDVKFMSLNKQHMGCDSITLPLSEGNMVKKTRKTIGFKKIMVYKIPPALGEVNHIWQLA